MLDYVRGSRLLVGFLLVPMIWAELVIAHPESGEPYGEQLDSARPVYVVTSRGDTRPTPELPNGREALVAVSKFPMPTLTPTPSPTPSPTHSPMPTETSTLHQAALAAHPGMQLSDLGAFRVTAYSDSPYLNGTDGRGITATGVKTHWGCVAVDPRHIPLGARLLIQGLEGTVFTAYDTGGGVLGNWVDIWFPTDHEAIKWGVQYRNIYLLTD